MVWLSLSVLIMCLKMYLGTFAFCLVRKKCKNTLWSREGWSPPPPFGRRFSFWIFNNILIFMLNSLYFPFLVLLNLVLLTMSFQGLVLLLSKPFTNIPSEALLITQVIDTSEIKTGIPMMLDLIYVHLKGSRPISSLVLPCRLRSRSIFSSNSNCVLEQGCFTSHLLSFDNNKVSK